MESKAGFFVVALANRIAVASRDILLLRKVFDRFLSVWLDSNDKKVDVK